MVKESIIKGTYFFQEENTWLDKNSVTLTQEQVDSMSDEDLELANKRLYCYANGVLKDINWYVTEYNHYIRYAYRRYQELRKQKVPYPFWRCKGMVELVLMEIPIKVSKFTTGFNIVIGTTTEDFIEYKISIDKKTGYVQSEQWYRVYKKTRVRTKEEQEEFDRNYREEKFKKLRLQWNRFAKKNGLKENITGKTFKDKEGALFELEGCKPRTKKLPICGKFTYPDKPEDNGYYSISIKYFKEMKEVK